ncbi:MAG: heme ABC transporter ATP-binding protein [Amphritea sp.]
MLSAQTVHLTIGDCVLLDNIDVSVDRGELLVVLGPNGAGKSSLLAVLAGMRLPTSGSVTLDRQSLQSIDSVLKARRLAMFTQQQPLNFSFTVTEVVRLGCYPLMLDSRGEERQVDKRLTRLELLAYAERDYLSLSGGEQQRVQLARVLAQVGDETQALLLDEPVSEMDLKHQQLTMTLLRELARQGVAVIVVLHDLNLAAQYADRICLLDRGQMIATGTVTEVMTEVRLSALYQVSVQRIEGATQQPLFVSSPQ